MCSHQTWTRYEYSTVSHRQPRKHFSQVASVASTGKYFQDKRWKMRENLMGWLGLGSEWPYENAGRERGAEHLLKASHTLRVGATQEMVGLNPFHLQTPAMHVHVQNHSRKRSFWNDQNPPWWHMQTKQKMPISEAKTTPAPPPPPMSAVHRSKASCRPRTYQESTQANKDWFLQL